MYSTLLVFSLFGRVVYASATLVTDFTRSLYTKPSMAPNNRQQQTAVAAAAIRLTEFYADSPQFMVRLP
jgi:hypothetical protein